MPHRRASRSTCGGSGGEASDREPVSSAIQRLAAVSRAPVAREWARAAPDEPPAASEELSSERRRRTLADDATANSSAREEKRRIGGNTKRSVRKVSF